MYESILVPTDGSDCATAAARHAVALGRRFDATVHLLSVVDERSHGSVLADIDAATSERRDAFEREATETVADLEPLVTDAGLSCRTAVEHGVPHEVVRTYAADYGVDLVAMGTHGRTGLDRLLMGSVAERVIRTSDVPVLAARRGPDDTAYDAVLVPTDGSAHAEAAVDHALAIADRFGATVHALSVVDVGHIAGGYDLGGGLPELVEAVTEASERAVEAVADRAEREGVEAVTRVVQGTPHGAIRDYVAEEGVDLVTMGTHGRSGLERYLLGSVTERTVRTSDAPVLTVRAETGD